MTIKTNTNKNKRIKKKNQKEQQKRNKIYSKEKEVCKEVTPLQKI